MSEQDTNTPINPGSPAQAIRAHADHEIDRELAQTHAQGTDRFDERVAFERELRQRLANAMADVNTPPALRERLVAALASENTDETVRTAMGDTREPSFWARAAAPLALAAALVLALTLALFNPSATNPNAGGTQTASIVPFQSIDHVAQILNIATGEHTRCQGFGDAFANKFSARTPAQAVEGAVDILGSIPTLGEHDFTKLDSLGYQFAGLGECGLPGGPSVHLMYTTNDPALQPISLFIQRVRNQDEADAWAPIAGKHCVQIPGDPKAIQCDGKDRPLPRDRADVEPGHTPSLIVWQHEGLIYYLVIPDSGAHERAPALGAPAEPIIL